MGGVTSQTSASVSLTKKRQEHDTSLRGAGGPSSISYPYSRTQGPFEGQSHWGGGRGVPSATESWQGSVAGEGEGRGGKQEEDQSAQSSIRSWKAISPYPGGATTRPRPNVPSLPNHTGQPQHLSLLPASPSVRRRLSDRAPERSRVAPPPAASPQPTRRR